MKEFGQNDNQKRRNYLKNSKDPQMIPTMKSKNRETQTGFVRLTMGSTLLVQPEPAYTANQAIVQLETGGNIMLNVPWPGPNVEANIVGLPFGPAIGIHGLHDGPLPGQKVLCGFIDGNSQKPVIVNKYPYSHSWRIDNDFTHILPLTTKLHSAFDVVLGHFMGSYIAMRAILIPGSIEVSAMTVLNLIAKVGITATTPGPVAITSGIGAIALTATAGTIAITAGTSVTITSTASPMILSAPTGVFINAGIFPAAAIGDLVATMLGPMPVLPGPGRAPTSLFIT